MDNLINIQKITKVYSKIRQECTFKQIIFLSIFKQILLCSSINDICLGKKKQDIAIAKTCIISYTCTVFFFKFLCFKLLDFLLLFHLLEWLMIQESVALNWIFVKGKMLIHLQQLKHLYAPKTSSKEHLHLDYKWMFWTYIRTY
jgi:hypothetical protein